LLHLWQVETLQISVSQWRHRQAVEKRQRSIDIIHVLTIRKRVKENFHLWASMIFVTSINNVRMLALIDSDFNQNFIDQRFAYEWRLRSDENSSTNSQTMNETFLRVFRFHLLEFSSNRDDERIFKIKQNLMSIHMMSVDVILRMFWLRKRNFQMIWMTNKWRFKKNSSKSSNNRRVAIDKQKSEDLKNESSDFYITQMSWSKLQFILSESDALAFATLFSLESKKKRFLIVIEKINENNNKINNEISSQYVAFQNIFFEVKTHKFSKHDSQNHVIEILSNRDFFFDFIYNLSAIKLKILKNYIDEYMKKNFIIEFVSFAKILILFVKKTNDKLRLCVDYKDLNEIIIKNRYSLSFINENLNKLFETKIFIKLNVKDVFHRIRIREEDEWKTTFRCRFDHYQYRVMLFELTNSSITFQVYINKTMHSYLDFFVLMYINDLLMFFSSIEKHIEHVKLMLQRLRQFNLYFKFNKCNFHVFHVNFLDFRMSLDEIARQTSKIIVVKDWSKSKSHKNVQVFIKFANFYKRFVHAFFKTSAKLISLLKKSEKEKFKIKFVMISETKKFMKQIKRIFMSASMLRHYELDDESMMKTNVFDFVITRIFSQFAEIDDQWRSIVFYFRKMIFVERNYEVNNQKMLVIVKICKK
jgi:hypothetical protein